MKLIHYTNKEFDLKCRDYSEDHKTWSPKPSGFWFSVEGEYDWKWWCESEKFNLENLAIAYEIILKPDTNILHLKTEEEVINFSKQYPYIRPQWRNPIGLKICASFELDWEKIKEKYQGIIIAPYQWKCRLHLDCNWYYGWDCASGCIWDLECIQEFKLIKVLENA